MKHLLIKKLSICFSVGFLSFFSELLCIAEVFASEEKQSPKLREVSDYEVSLYKGLVPGTISRIHEKAGIVTFYQKNKGKHISIDVPIGTIPKQYIIKRGEFAQSLLSKGSSGYPEHLNILSDKENIRRALAIGRYERVPKKPEKEAVSLNEQKAIHIKETEK